MTDARATIKRSVAEARERHSRAETAAARAYAACTAGRLPWSVWHAAEAEARTAHEALTAALTARSDHWRTLKAAARAGQAREQAERDAAKATRLAVTRATRPRAVLRVTAATGPVIADTGRGWRHRLPHLSGW